jgi:PmbA protein
MNPAASSTRAPFDPALAEASLAAACDELVRGVELRGQDAAEAYGMQEERISVRFQKGDLELATVHEGSSLGLRVIHEGRVGFVSTNQTQPADLARTVEDACALAGFAVPDEAAGLLAPDAPAVELEGPRPELLEFSIDEVVQVAADLVERCLAIDPRLSLDQAGAELSRASVCLRSSLGAQAGSSEATLSLSLFGMAVDGSDVGGFDYDSDVRRDPRGLEVVSERIARQFARAALGNLGAGAAESYRGRVLFAPAAFQSVFISPLLSAASALAVQRGRSALAGKLGQRVASDELELFDDPHARDLAGTRPFDREGWPTARTAIVEQGRLATYLYNGYAARVDRRSSTGHARGGARSLPGLGVHAPSVAGGSGGSAEDMLGLLGRGLLVQRFSGSVDPASGDFSGVAKSARWVESGSVQRPVRETLISGNVFQLLLGALTLSSESERIHGSSRMPWALVDGLSVTAG